MNATGTDRGRTGPNVPVIGIGVGDMELQECAMLLRQLRSDLGQAVIIAGSETAAQSWCTRLPVVPLTRDQPLETGQAYLVPPDAIATVQADGVHLVPRSEAACASQPIDQLFRSLAQARGELARGVLLSRSTRDGRLGAREIRCAGGLTFATEPAVDPIEGDLAADLVLQPDEIAGFLCGLGAREASGWSTDELERLTGLFFVLKEATGTDFSRMRGSSVLRQVRRRMTLLGVRELGAYVHRLARDPREIERLHRDLCRKPTRFFREPALIEPLRALFAERMRERFADPLRIWVVGCGTGEEAYSLAMLLAEAAAESDNEVPVKVFATDIDERALERARVGLYPDEIRLDVSVERLHRHFVQGADGQWKVKPALRDLCTFAKHDPLLDPPYSQLDLLWCHGVLEHLDPVSAARLLPRLHRGLKPTGRIYLGRIDGALVADLFEPVDGLGLYARRASEGSGWSDSAALREPGSHTRRVELQWRTDEVLLERFAPPAVVIDERWNILLFRGQIAPYVAPRTGQPNLNLEHMGHPELLPEIRRLLTLAGNSPVRGVPTPIRRAHGVGIVQVDVVPLRTQGGRAWLITFEESVGHSEPSALQGAQVWAERVARLAREVEEVRQSLGARLRMREEELDSSREEMTTLSEEFQTAHQDLAHARRALELAQQELRERNLALAALRDKLQLPLAAVDLPMVTIGADLRIVRATSAAAEVFRVRSSDVGRPIGQLHGALPRDLEEAIREAVERGTSSRSSLRDASGRWWAVSIRGLHSAEGRSVGVLMLAVDTDPPERREIWAADTSASTLAKG